jgi:hypothetical protein
VKVRGLLSESACGWSGTASDAAPCSQALALAGVA